MSCDCEQHVRTAFAFERARLSLEVCEKGTKTRRRKVEAAISRIMLEWFAEILPGLLDWATDRITKTDLPPELDPTKLFELLVGPLTDAFEIGVDDTLGVLGITFDVAPEQAIAFATERAAELVGMRRAGTGFIPNPNPKWAVTETDRRVVRDVTKKALDEGWSPQRLTRELKGHFKKPRARTIARTELAFASGRGAAKTYLDAGVRHLLILDGPGCLPDKHRDGAPKAKKLVGVVQIEHEANGQIWTVAQYQGRPIAHPNCTRAASPYIEGT